MRKPAIWLALSCAIAVAAIVFVRTAHKHAQVEQKVRALKQAMTPRSAMLTEAADPKHRGECEQALRAANHNGTVLNSWKLYGAHVNVRVRNGYYHTDLEHRQSLDKALRCVAADGREQDQGLKQVTYRDMRSDELVALWDKPNGFKMAIAE